jgi:capsular exopolysaccharide synthesis family protein
MSRNFELLQQIEKEHEVFSAPIPPAVSGNGHRPRFNHDAFGQEERMKLVQRLFILPGLEAPRVVMFCGVESGDGSSWVCARASETLASQVKASVCVVDANFRTPSLHEHFRTDNLLGLADAVRQSGPARDFAHQLNGGNLWLITCGSKTPDPHALLTSDLLHSRITELRAEFDYILVDGPPVNLYADATLLGRLADGVVLVLQANFTRREAAIKAKESLQAAKVRVCGAVLNKRTFPVPDFLYRKI